LLVAAVLVGSAIWGCQSNPPGSKKDSGVDAGVDRTVDRPIGTGHDAGADTGRDAGTDVRADGSADRPPGPFSGYSWTAFPLPLGARVNALALDSEGVLYAGAASDTFPVSTPGAGIFKSTDQGTSWHAASLGLIDDAVATLAAVGTTMYASAEGLMRSTDRGASWQLMASVGVGGPFETISGQGDLVVAGDTTGNPFYLSTDTGRTFNAAPGGPSGGLDNFEVLSGGSVILWAGAGVFRSTDRGATFSPVQGISNGFQLFAHVSCDGVSTCYANAYDTPNAANGQVLLKSTDTGATWTPLPQPLLGGIVAVSDTGSVYMEGPLTLSRSDDGGATFNPIGCPTAVNPAEPDCTGNQVAGPYVARGDTLFDARRLGVYRSDDKGEHWQAASGSAATGAIIGAATWVFVDTGPAALGPNGDIYAYGLETLDPVTGPVARPKRSSDDGQTWQVLADSFGGGQCVSTPGGAIECVNVTFAPGDGGAVGRSVDHGATWNAADTPPALGALAVSGSVVYLAGPAGVARSIDDGVTFQLIPNGPMLGSLQALHDGHLLATQEIGLSTGTGGYRSVDQGATWQSIANLPLLPVVEDAAGRLLQDTLSGTIEVSTDEGDSWTALATTGAPQVGTNFLPFTADGAGHLFAFGRLADSAPYQIFASADGGASFAPMPVQIPNPFAIWFATDKLGRLLVGTGGGLFRLEPAATP
jgi:hypothetical protein